MSRPKMASTIDYVTQRRQERAARPQHYSVRERQWMPNVFYGTLACIFLLDGLSYLMSPSYLNAGTAFFYYYLGSTLLAMVVCVVLRVAAPRFADYPFSGGFLSTWMGLAVFFGGMGYGVLLNQWGASPIEREYRITGFATHYSHTRKEYGVHLEDSSDHFVAWFGPSYNDAHRINDVVRVRLYHGTLGFDYVRPHVGKDWLDH